MENVYKERKDDRLFQASNARTFCHCLQYCHPASTHSDCVLNYTEWVHLFTAAGLYHVVAFMLDSGIVDHNSLVEVLQSVPSYSQLPCPTNSHSSASKGPVEALVLCSRNTQGQVLPRSEVNNLICCVYSWETYSETAMV